LGGEIFRRELGEALRHLRQVDPDRWERERQVCQFGHRITAGRHAMKAPGDIDNAVTCGIELPVGWPAQLAIGIHLELQPPVRFFFDLLGPGGDPLVERMLWRHEVRELQCDRLSLYRSRSEREGGG